MSVSLSVSVLLSESEWFNGRIYWCIGGGVEMFSDVGKIDCMRCGNLSSLSRPIK